MGDLVNLNRFKKRTVRENAAKEADANRLKFGRTKSERSLDEHRADKIDASLDAHRLDGEDAS